MKKIFFLSLIIFGCFFTFTEVNAQAKKPTIMVIPSSNWCKKNNFKMVYDNQGRKEEVDDYERAFNESTVLQQVITKMGSFFRDRGYPAERMDQVIKQQKTIEAEDMLTTSKTGSSLSESPLDKLKKVAKTDIIVTIDWDIEENGPFKQVNYISLGLDAYTNKQVADAAKVGQPNAAASVSLLLETAILANMDNFLAGLQSHFDDLRQNGREITLEIRKYESFDGDLESEFDGKELTEIIGDWVSKNTKNGVFSLKDYSENLMNFNQVRIPFYDESGRAIDAKDWANSLKKYLKSTYKIDSKLLTRGLGNARLIIGEK